MAMKDCYARSYCKGYDNDRLCSYECVAYHQMNNIYELSQLPKRYRYELPLRPDEIDYGAFTELKDWITVEEIEVDGNRKFKHNVVDKVQSGRGLFLWSEVKGNGKTSWAAKILNAYCRAVGVTNNLRTRVLYVSVPELLQDMRDAMDGPSEELKDKLDKIKRVDVVLFDDIGTESPTTWVREQLYILINKRYSENLCTIFTSNISLAQVGHEEVLGDRIASRIKGSCDIIHFQGTDKR